MYYLLYAILYLLSLIPFRVLYLISDFFYFILYRLVGYRRKVVMANLAIAFPNKTEAEKTQIAKEFYRNFIDTFIETIKFLSISDRSFRKRVTGNFEILEQLHKEGKNVHLHSGHFFNWEYMNWAIPAFTPFRFIGVYYPSDNKAFEKLMLKIRQRYGGFLLTVRNFRTSFHHYAKQQYALGLYADQNPSNLGQSFWLPFFGRITPFLAGPEKSARISNATVVFANHYKVKRGYYHVTFSIVTSEPREFERGQLTKLFVSFLEKSIQERPYNYLWSHRRWKHEYREEFKRMLI